MSAAFPQRPQIVPQIAHDRALLVNASPQRVDPPYQRPHERSLLELALQERIANPRGVVIDLIDVARSGFDVGLEIVEVRLCREHSTLGGHP